MMFKRFIPKPSVIWVISLTILVLLVPTVFNSCVGTSETPTSESFRKPNNNGNGVGYEGVEQDLKAFDQAFTLDSRDSYFNHTTNSLVGFVNQQNYLRVSASTQCNNGLPETGLIERSVSFWNNPLPVLAFQWTPSYCAPAPQPISPSAVQFSYFNNDLLGHNGKLYETQDSFDPNNLRIAQAWCRKESLTEKVDHGIDLIIRYYSYAHSIKAGYQFHYTVQIIRGDKSGQESLRSVYEEIPVFKYSLINADGNEELALLNNNFAFNVIKKSTTDFSGKIVYNFVSDGSDSITVDNMKCIVDDLSFSNGQ